MENKLEQLLNSLIERGWKPRGYENCIRLNMSQGYIPYMEDENRSIEIDKSIRDLIAKESGLWQFVCENGMVKEGHKHERILDPTFGEGWADCKRQEHDGNYGYRLIESSLKDESELEDFLLSNIVIKENEVGTR